MTYRRIRARVTIDADSASPDSIDAASTYLTRSIFEQAEDAKVALDWNSWRTYARRARNGDMVMIQWVRVARG